MSFENPGQEELYRTVYEWLLEEIEDADELTILDDDDGFLVRVGSTAIVVRINPWGDDDGSIGVAGLVACDVELTRDLLLFLLQKNSEEIIGAFEIDEQARINISHSIMGKACNEEQFITSLRHIAELADQYDDEIIDKWGGRRYADIANSDESDESDDSDEY